MVVVVNKVDLLDDAEQAAVVGAIRDGLEGIIPPENIVPAMAALGYLYGFVWRRAVTRGGPWTSQYVILSALSIYLVMQTMEAVIFRTLLLSTPCWLAWRWARRARPVLRSTRLRRPVAVAALPLAGKQVEHV